MPSIPPHPPHQLEVQHLHGHYGSKCVLHDVTFRITCGHRLAILGPNGAGKSTLLRILAGSHPAASGQIQWRESPLTPPSREIAFLPQRDAHQSHFPLSVCEVVAMGRYPYLGPFRPGTPADQQAIDHALETMHLQDLATRQIDQLSGGQQQRVYLARALAQQAHILLLDEPFNGLDLESRCQLAESMETLTAQGHLLIASHHQLENVTNLFDQALVLSTRQIAFGPTSDVMAQPAVAQLLHACHPTLPTPHELAGTL